MIKWIKLLINSMILKVKKHKTQLQTAIIKLTIQK